MNMLFKRVCITIYIVLQTLLIVSCGGGGSSSGSSGSTPTGPSNTTPTTPTVSMVQPTNNATNASISQVIELSFSEPVTNVTESTVTLHESSPTGITVPTTDIVLNGDGKSYTFSSTSHLIPSTKYYVVVGSGIKSVSGNIGVAPTNFNFQTSEYASPTVNMTNPGNGATDVSTSQIIALQFSESVSNVTESTVVLHEGGPTGKVINTSITAVDASNYTFQPESLSGGTTYYVEVTNQITSTATGESLTPAEFSFTTSQSITAPTVVMLNPSNNGTTGSLNPDITIQFSESVEHLTTTSITLHEGSESGPKVEYYLAKKLTNNTYVFKPEESLALNTTYYLVLTNEITSVSTGAPLIPAVFNFTVKASGFAYITYMDGISVCVLNGTTGGLENCSLNNFGQGAVGISANSAARSIYLVNKESNSISTCRVDDRTGGILSCVDTKGFDNPVSITVSKDGLYAYVLNYSGSKSVVVCTIDVQGTLQNCKPTAYMPPVESGSTGALMYFVDPTNITIDSNNKYAYIADAHDNTITTCTIDDSHDLTNCVLYKNSAFFKLSALAVSTDGSYLYMGNDIDVSYSAINQTDGTINSILNSPRYYTEISDIVSYNNKLYIADKGNGAITVCEEVVDGSDGLKNCHYTKLDLFKATGIAVLPD